MFWLQKYKYYFRNKDLLTNVVEEVSEGEYTIRIKMKE